MKRFLDVIISLILLPFALPVCLVLMAAIRLDSPGAPLFIQERVGRAKHPFRLFKLRTMRAGTEHAASHMVSVARITRLGSLLRKLKLDELPQLWNVLNGTMSLVGPRPCLAVQADLVEERDSRGLYRLRPGVTGPAQVVGVDMADPKRLATLEAEYFDRSTVWNDLILLWQTATGAGRGDATKARPQV